MKEKEALLEQKKRLIAELIATVENRKIQASSPDVVRQAMDLLGEYRAVEGVNVLVKYVAYPVTSESNLVIDLRPIEKKCPAVAALRKVGEACINEIINKLATTGHPAEIEACMLVLKTFSVRPSIEMKLRLRAEDAPKLEKERLDKAIQDLR